WPPVLAHRIEQEVLFCPMGRALTTRSGCFARTALSTATAKEEYPEPLELCCTSQVISSIDFNWGLVCFQASSNCVNCLTFKPQNSNWLECPHTVSVLSLLRIRRQKDGADALLSLTTSSLTALARISALSLCSGPHTIIAGAWLR